MGIIKQAEKNNIVDSISISSSSSTTKDITISSSNACGILTIIIVGKTTSPSLRVLDRYYEQGFKLLSNSYTALTTILDAGYVYLSVALSAVGSGNKLRITATNTDASGYTFNGLIWIKGYVEVGYFTLS